MQLPLEVTYRGLERNDFIHDLIQKKSTKLERACPHMISCRVVLEREQKQKRTGSEYKIRVELGVPPGHNLVVTRKTLILQAQKDLPPLVREAFEAAERKIKELAAQQKGRVKSHPQQEIQAFIDQIFPGEDYGYIRTVDGREIMFHRNSLVNENFDALEVGAGVAFELAEDPGAARASSVRVMGR